MTVHRNGNQTEVHVWKSRFKWVGKIGMIELKYDLPTGTYSDKEAVMGNTDYDWNVDL